MQNVKAKLMIIHSNTTGNEFLWLGSQQNPSSLRGKEADDTNEMEDLHYPQARDNDSILAIWAHKTNNGWNYWNDRTGGGCNEPIHGVCNQPNMSKTWRRLFRPGDKYTFLQGLIANGHNAICSLAAICDTTTPTIRRNLIPLLEDRLDLLLRTVHRVSSSVTRQ